MALHQNSNENNKHTPKGFTSAPNMGKILRDENGLSTYVPETTLPASLNFVNGAVAPPTEVLNQVYVIVDTGGGTIHPNWDGLVYNNWCRFNGASWIGYTPVNGDICYDSTALKYKIFQTTAWVDFGVSGGGGGGDNLSTTDLVQADEDRNYTIPSSKKLIFGGLGGEVRLQDAVDFKMFNGDSATASNVRYSAFIGANTCYLDFNNARTHIRTVSDSLTLTGQVANPTISSQVILSADVTLKSNGTRAIKLRTANLFFQDVAGTTNYGHIDDDEFYWGAINPIGSEKFSIQVDTLVKGSDTSASTSGFKVLDSTNASLLEVRNNGQTGINGAYDGSNALMVRNPNNEPFILELENFAGTPAFQVTDSGQLLTKQSNAIVFYTYRQGGQSRIQLFDGAVKSFEFNKVLSFTTGQLVIDGSTGKTKSILTLNQASASVNAQNFFANITTTTAGRVASSSAFGTAEKGYECFDTDINKKFVWTGSAWEKITSV